MPQIAKDYEQVSTRLGLPPSFVNAPTAPSEHWRRRENFLDLLRRYGVTIDVLRSVEVPFQVIDAHARVAGVKGLLRHVPVACL
jgi:hypothetical protein